MCGIVGYIGPRQAAPVLLDGLERLSYRGYDSAGIAVTDESGRIHLKKTSGKLENLRRLLNDKPPSGCAGIGHTRWATHGEPSALNAHPHMDGDGGIAVVHNGIIENHEELRRRLSGQGAEFVRQTDTEVIAHLLHQLYDGDMRIALIRAAEILRGSYALAVLCDREPGRIFCARNDSPLVIGLRNGEGFLASDIPALLSHTRDVIFLQDREIAVLTAQEVQICDASGKRRQNAFFHVDWDLSSAEKDGYDHYMLKEIHEQPAALRSAFASRGQCGDYSWFPLGKQEVQKLRRITIAACGTAWHAAVFGKYVIEELARVPVEAAIASEYRYRNPIVDEDELFIAVSQSGETADTLAALREAKGRHARVIAICNTVGSTIAREAGEKYTLYTYAGPEIAVASTKAYITQTEMMLLIAAALGTLRSTAADERIQSLFKSLAMLPDQVQEALKTLPEVRRLAGMLSRKTHAFFVGRGLDYALSMEAALKLKEVSYIFSEAYAAGELKHGPIALLQKGQLVVACVTQSRLLEKTMSNLREAAARGAHVVAVCSRRLAGRVRDAADEIVEIPDTEELLAPLLALIPLQLFAYCMAVERGCDVDKPRNLAKSVTVE